MLPGRDGIEVLAAIRRAKPALPVILLTAKAEVADRVEGLDLGATDYVTKPFAFEELLARVRARLRDGEADRDDARGRRDQPRPAQPRGDPRGLGGPAARARGRAARLPDAPRGPGLHPRGDPLRGLGIRPRPRHQRRPGLRRLPAPQARPARLAGADRDRALGRLPTAGSGEARLAGLGLRGRLALSIGAIVDVAFAVVFVAVQAEMAHESNVIKREEAKRDATPQDRGEPGERLLDLADRGRPVRRREDLPRWSAGRRLVAALLAGYLLAARTASPLRRFAATAAEVDAGDLDPAARSRARRGGRAAHPRRGLQPHARPPRRRLRPAAAVRLRRLARAAQPADRDPRPARGAGPRGEPERRGGAPGRGGWR